MPTMRDCIKDIHERTGRPRDQIEDLANEIFERAREYEADGMTIGDAYVRARDELLQEISESYALIRRGEIMNVKKQVSLHRYFDTVRNAIDALPISGKMKDKLAQSAARIALEAKLVGVNLPVGGNRKSVDAQFMALRKGVIGGFAADLEKGGLLKIFASRSLEGKWTDELFELNKRGGGNPGVTGDAHALQIAKTIQKWQKDTMDRLNREGAWVKSYSGYITRTSHSADLIKAAGPEAWVADVMPRLDLKKTFGTTDPQRARDALRAMWAPFAKGDHFDYGKPLDEPLYPNAARQASVARELHFKTGSDWRAYNDKYGVTNPTRTVVGALDTAARRIALMREFGTKPREMYDHTKKFVLARLQAESDRLSSKLGALEEAGKSPAVGAEQKAKIETDMADLRKQIAATVEQHQDFQSWQQALDNRFAQIDGSAKRPVNRTLANLTSNWMSIQRMAKLGRVALTHFASLPTKAAELRYWGIRFAQRYGSLFRGLTRGAEGSDKRAVLDALHVGMEARIGTMLNMYDVADAPRGALAKLESMFFRLTGVSSVVENQRGDAEAMFAGHIGGKRGQAWADIGPKEQRVLQGFDIGEKEWKALHGVEWTDIGGRTYLTPSDAMKLTDDQVKAYLKDTGFNKFSEPTVDDIAKGRDDLASRIATAYHDRAGYAVPMPSAKTRAQMFGKNFEPGTPLNTALRLMLQFKMWPLEMINRAWGREMYGTIGDGKYDRIAGVMEYLVGSIVFGVASEAVRAEIQGKDALHELATKPFAAIARGASRSGFGSLFGDYLLGEYDRHGFSAVGSLAGPTFSQIDTLMDMLHAGERTKSGMWSATANRERASDLMHMAHDNLPFMNLWFSGLAMDTLVWHRLQEWISPGYLKRAQQRQEQQNGTKFWMSPAKTDRWVTGHAASPF